MKTIFAILSFVSLTSAYKPVQMCTPDINKEATYCRCLFYHPQQEFCESDTAPLPSCCRATEKKSKIHVCGCCRSVYGSKRNINELERGSYEHGVR